MATQFTLRATKCPGCGASVPVQAGWTSVTCEYCGLTSQLVTQGSKPNRRLPSGQETSPSAPQATAHVRPWLVLMMAIVPILVTTGVTVAVARSPAGPPPTLAPTVTTTRPAPPAASEQVSSPGSADTSASETPTAEPTPEPVADPAPEQPAATEAAAPAPKPARKPKPKPYDIARLLEPLIADCAPNDLSGTGHPVWYSPTITVTVRDGRFEKVDVTVKPSDTDVAKIHFKGDYARAVTQSDLDRRVAKTDQCVTRAVQGAKIPPGDTQAKAEGRIRFSLTHDGVPYGVKNL